MLKYGDGLMQLLKQPLGRPLSMAEQVVTLCAATHKVFMDIPTDQVKETQMKMISFFNEHKPDVMGSITIGQELTPDIEKKITDEAFLFVRSIFEEKEPENTANKKA